MSKVKQVIVVRTKYPDGKDGTKGLRAGKLIAQATHAAMAFITNRLREAKWNQRPSAFSQRINNLFSVAEWEWIEGNFAKVCCQVQNEVELRELYEKAQIAGLEAHLIQDSGLTEFDGVPTITALAIGPDYSEKIDPITGSLKLY
jgi:peptidyl-tRNA hydrolase, PTH2 family